MSQSTYHSLRLQVLNLANDLHDFAQEVDCRIPDLGDVKERCAAPAMVGVIGTPDCGMRKLVERLAEMSEEETLQLRPTLDYNYTIHPQARPPQAIVPENAYTLESNSDYLQKLAFVEIRRQFDTTILPTDPVAKTCDGLIFVIDARDPWSGTLWKHFSNYVTSHENRIVVCLSRLEHLDTRDWPVLKKHLEEKIAKTAPHPLNIILLTETKAHQKIREFLEDHTIRASRWDELREAATVLQDAFSPIETFLGDLQDTLTERSSELDDIHRDITSLKSHLHLDLSQRIDTMATRLVQSRNSIIDQIKSKLTLQSYFHSILGKTPSLESFQSSLESALSEALLSELMEYSTQCNTAIHRHIQFSRENFADLLKLAPQLDHISPEHQFTPTISADQTHLEVHKLLNKLRLKPLFQQELEQIDRNTNNCLKLASFIVIIAGTLGCLSMSLYGAGCLALAALTIIIGFQQRRRKLSQFYQFLEEWFVGVGSRMHEPTELLSEEISQKALDNYVQVFGTASDTLQRQQTNLPTLFNQARSLAIKNRELSIDLAD